MWIRKGAFTHQCPKSVITSQSFSYIEQFNYWKSLSGFSLLELDSKAADALLILDRYAKGEQSDGK